MTPPPRTDLLIDTFDSSWATVREVALAAETAGLDGVWVHDHLSGAIRGHDHVLEAGTLLAALAATVPRVVLGPLVLNVNNRDPFLLAQLVATLQQVAEGRLIVGLGAGAAPIHPAADEQRMVGRFPQPDGVRRRQVVEHLAVLRNLWGDDDTDLRGEFHTVRRARGFLSPEPTPPIIVGVSGFQMAQLAGRVADGINVHALTRGRDALIRHARTTADGMGHGADFLVTVSVPWELAWLDPDSDDRGALVSAGVDRVIVVSPPGIQPDAVARAVGR